MTVGEWHSATSPAAEVSLLARLVRNSWRAGRRPYAGFAGAATVVLTALGEQEPRVRPFLDRFGVERAGLPVLTAVVRLPLSLVLSSPNLPAWGAALQVFAFVSLGEMLVGWRRTVAVGLLAHAAATMSARFMIALGSGPLSLPNRYLTVRDTGPSAAVVAIAVYVVVRMRAYWLLAAIAAVMVAEVIALPNLAGHEHLTAIGAGLAVAAAEPWLARIARPAGLGAAVQPFSR